MSTTPPTYSGEQAYTQLVAMQDRLDRLATELEHSHRLATLGTMAAGVAHEINNLLTPAMAFTQLASLRPDDAAMREKALDRASIAMKSVAELLASLVDFSLPGEGYAAAVDLAVDQAIACLPRNPQRDDITIRKSIPPGLQVAIPPLAIQQVLLNLLLNACRALREQGPPPGGNSRISVAATLDSRDRVRITISDNGPGIPTDLADRLFDPFVRGTAQGTGAGLGLAMCRATIEAANGTIALSRGTGRGAAFEITLATAQASSVPKVG